MDTNQAQQPSQFQMQAQTPQERTIYNSSYSGIFFRNFLAGMARSLGGILVYLLFMAFVSYIFATVVWPQLAPTIEIFQNIGSMSNPHANPGATNSIQVDPETARQLLEQFNR